MFLEQLKDNSKSGISQGASHFLLRQLDVFTDPTSPRSLSSNRSPFGSDIL